MTTALRHEALAGSCIGLWTLFFFQSPLGSLRLFVIRSRTFRNARTRRPTRHLFSRDAVSSVENVCQDEALMGVARNPLRDGAPPTGSTHGHCPTFSMRARRHEGESTKPTPRFIVHRVSGARPVARCAEIVRPATTILGRRRTNGRPRRSSRRCSPSSKTIWSNALRFLLAQLQSNEALTFVVRVAAGLVSPPASPVDCNLTRGRK